MLDRPSYDDDLRFRVFAVPVMVGQAFLDHISYPLVQLRTGGDPAGKRLVLAVELVG